MRNLLLTAPLSALALLAFPVAHASAVTPAPGWTVSSLAEPTNFNSGETQDRYTVTAMNVGTRDAEGDIAVKDRVSPGVTVVEASIEEPRSQSTEELTTGECSWSAEVVRCTYGKGPVAPGDELLVTIRVTVAPTVSGTVLNRAEVSGGGALRATTSESTSVNSGSAPFGIDQLAFEVDGPSGEPERQAGDHPSSVTTRLAFNTVSAAERGLSQKYVVAEEIKDVAVELPLGFVGDPLATERCPEVI